MRQFRLLAIVLLAVASIARADEAPPRLQTGQRLAAMTLNDQNDSPQRIDESVRLLLFSSDMDGNKLVKEALPEGGKDLLVKAGAVYVADISPMPGIITQLFALPAMRKRDYPILLDRSGDSTRSLPRHEGQVTAIDLDRLTVTKVTYLDSPAAIRHVLAAPVTPTAEPSH